MPWKAYDSFLHNVIVHCSGPILHDELVLHRAALAHWWMISGGESTLPALLQCLVYRLSPVLIIIILLLYKFIMRTMVDQKVELRRRLKTLDGTGPIGLAE